MVWWQMLLLAMVGAAACGIGYQLGLGRGLERGERLGRADRRMGAASLADDEPLFGTEPSVRACEESFVRSLPGLLLLVAEDGAVRYAASEGGAASSGQTDGSTSDGADPFGLVDAGRVTGDVRDMLACVASDGVRRQREIAVAPHDAASASPHRGRPQEDKFLDVTVSALGGGAYAVHAVDVSERRRFESMRRDFVTNVSHELKTPTGAIALLAETIESAADDPDAVRYFAGRVAKESTRLSELVGRLIELQRAQNASESPQAQQRQSVLAVARNAIEANLAQADHHATAVELSLNGAPVALEADRTDSDAADAYVRCDGESLTTAVKNLVENAIRYSPEGTVVRVAIAVKDGRVAIRVIDQGIGIPAASIDRIFERFYRVDPARSRETGGSGLGLSIVRHCVEACGGTVTVWSHEGEGSTFTIDLPEDADAAADTDAAGATGNGPTQPATEGRS